MSRIDCDSAMAHLHDYLKHELTADLLVEVRQHLERCRPCFSSAQFEERFLLLLEQRREKETCPKELRARILAALRSEARKD